MYFTNEKINFDSNNCILVKAQLFIMLYCFFSKKIEVILSFFFPKLIKFYACTNSYYLVSNKYFFN